MAIRKGIVSLASSVSNANMVSIGKFILPTLSDTAGIYDPLTNEEVSARGLIFKAIGTIVTVDPLGHQLTQVVSQSMVDSGEPLKGYVNAVKLTNTDTAEVSTIAATDIIVVL